MNHRTLPVFFTIISAALFAAVLLLFTPDAAASQVGPCADQSRITSAHFVWGVALDDPDGGLITRAGPGVGSARISVLAPRQASVWLTGQCSTSTTGSVWYEIWNHPASETAWVSGNFIRPAQAACLRDNSQVTGFAITSDQGVAFVGNGYVFEYSFLPSEAVVFRHCAPTLAVQPPPFIPNYVPPTAPPYFGPVPVPNFGSPPVPAPYVGPPPLFQHQYGGAHPQLVVCG